MRLTIVEEPLGDYGSIPCAFVAAESYSLDAIHALARGEPAEPTPLESPFLKDYDAHPDSDPRLWARNFDLRRWIILAAFVDDVRAGGAALIVDEPALLWDLRVAPSMRRRGVASALLDAVVERAARRGAGELLVETQQINVPACRLYARHGFRLEHITFGAYPDLPDEIQLLWSRTLTS